LIEAELFGIGANVATNVDFREGRFRLADGGTLFLNEIAELPIELQAKLLQVLEAGEVERVGGDSVSIDVRFICATNKNLGDLLKANLFRLDLFYRINTLTLELPPLSHRPKDIPLLAEAFWRHYQDKYRKNMGPLPDSTKKNLVKYPWPGNVRELRNEIERAVILEQTDIRPGHSASYDNVSRESVGSLHQQLEKFERSLIQEALEQTGWNIAQAARTLRVPDGTLRSRIKSLSIHRSGI
jgi:transcriptional regulator with GAF, ATPase, and Fis domain